MGKYIWSLIVTVFKARLPTPTGSHVHRKSGGIKEMVQERRVVTARRQKTGSRQFKTASVDDRGQTRRVTMLANPSSNP